MARETCVLLPRLGFAFGSNEPINLSVNALSSLSIWSKSTNSSMSEIVSNISKLYHSSIKFKLPAMGKSGIALSSL